MQLSEPEAHPSRRSITKRQKEILDFIRDYESFEYQGDGSLLLWKLGDL